MLSPYIQQHLVLDQNHPGKFCKKQATTKNYRGTVDVRVVPCKAKLSVPDIGGASQLFLLPPPPPSGLSLVVGSVRLVTNTMPLPL